MDQFEAPNEQDLEKARFQIFHQTKQYELSQQIYPICLQQCVSHADKQRKAVFTQPELTCAHNCIGKYRTSLQMLVGYLSGGGD